MIIKHFIRILSGGIRGSLAAMRWEYFVLNDVGALLWSYLFVLLHALISNLLLDSVGQGNSWQSDF